MSTMGGFSERASADNVFILNALIQRQIIKGENLIVCFVDFSRAFDLINRHTLFHKLLSKPVYTVESLIP